MGVSKHGSRTNLIPIENLGNDDDRPIGLNLPGF